MNMCFRVLIGRSANVSRDIVACVCDNLRSICERHDPHSLGTLQTSYRAPRTRRGSMQCVELQQSVRSREDRHCSADARLLSHNVTTLRSAGARRLCLISKMSMFTMLMTYGFLITAITQSLPVSPLLLLYVVHSCCCGGAAGATVLSRPINHRPACTASHMPPAIKSPVIRARYFRSCHPRQGQDICLSGNN